MGEVQGRALSIDMRTHMRMRGAQEHVPTQGFDRCSTSLDLPGQHAVQGRQHVEHSIRPPQWRCGRECWCEHRGCKCE